MAEGAVSIRKMTNHDLGRVNGIDQRLHGEDRLPTWPFSFEAYWNVQRPRLSYVAEIDGMVVGFVVGNIVEEEHSQSVARLSIAPGPQPHDQKIGWVDMIGIDQDFQRRNIGKLLIEAFEAECTAQEATVRGIVRDGDARMEKFLTGLGFKKQETVIFEK